MNYKGYEASIHFDEEDKIFWGEVVNLGSKSMILFHSENANDLESEFHASVDAYLETCATTGCAPKKPFSGKMLIRTTPSIHAKAVASAKTQGISVNKLVEQAIIERVQTH